MSGASDPPPARGLLLEDAERRALWDQTLAAIERYTAEIPGARVTPELDLEALRRALARLDFEAPMDPAAAVDLAVEGLWSQQVHTPHPRYFGLFNPAPTSMGIAADTLVAAFNPQLAAWSHNPFANEVERHVIRRLGSRFWPADGAHPGDIDGTFASGGAEANHTALLTAFAAAFPETAESGLRALRGDPVVYISTEGHHSFHKAARSSGLGTRAVRAIATDPLLRMEPGALRRAIASDRASGRLPFMIVATAGTTSAGAIDPLGPLAEIAAAERIWYHVDAAWGGAAAFVPEMRPLLAGIERADSVTFDAHKWLSVPMGAGVFLTRHPEALDRTFATGADYMPRDAAGLPVKDPYARSMQWSRRFTGLKVFLSLLVAGWEGYARAIRHQTAMGASLRLALGDRGWVILNPLVELPVVCFADGTRPDGSSEAYLRNVCAHVVTSGAAWISTARIGSPPAPALRACITNYRTQPEDLLALADALEAARRACR